MPHEAEVRGAAGRVSSLKALRGVAVMWSLVPREVTLPDGTRAAVLDVAPPEDAPAAVREGFARRAIVNAGGICPCGAVLVMPNRAQRRSATRRGVALQADARHQDDCPAITSTLARLILEAGE